MSIRRNIAQPTQTGTGMSFNPETGHISMSANDILGMAHPFLSAGPGGSDTTMVNGDETFNSGKRFGEPNGQEQLNKKPFVYPLPKEPKAFKKNPEDTHHHDPVEISEAEERRLIIKMLKDSVIAEVTFENFHEETYHCIFGRHDQNAVKYVYATREGITDAGQSLLDEIETIAFLCKKLVSEGKTIIPPGPQRTRILGLMKTVDEALKVSREKGFIRRLGYAVPEHYGPLTNESTIHSTRVVEPRHRPARGGKRGGAHPHDTHGGAHQHYTRGAAHPHKGTTRSGHAYQHTGLGGVLDDHESIFCQCETPSVLDAPFRGMSLGASSASRNSAFCQCEAPSVLDAPFHGTSLGACSAARNSAFCQCETPSFMDSRLTPVNRARDPTHVTAAKFARQHMTRASDYVRHHIRDPLERHGSHGHIR